jgi:hypothetical protein
MSRLVWPPSAGLPGDDLDDVRDRRGEVARATQCVRLIGYARGTRLCRVKVGWNGLARLRHDATGSIAAKRATGGKDTAPD